MSEKEVIVEFNQEARSLQECLLAILERSFGERGK